MIPAASDTKPSRWVTITEGRNKQTYLRSRNKAKSYGRPSGRPLEATATGKPGRPRKAPGGQGRPREATEGQRRPLKAPGGHGRPREATEGTLETPGGRRGQFSRTAFGPPTESSPLPTPPGPLKLRFLGNNNNMFTNIIIH